MLSASRLSNSPLSLDRPLQLVRALELQAWDFSSLEQQLGVALVCNNQVQCSSLVNSKPLIGHNALTISIRWCSVNYLLLQSRNWGSHQHQLAINATPKSGTACSPPQLSMVQFSSLELITMTEMVRHPYLHKFSNKCSRKLIVQSWVWLGDSMLWDYSSHVPITLSNCSILIQIRWLQLASTPCQ